MEKECKKYYDFYSMVKKSSKDDYYTPGLKAEVIFDMLLLEFIEEIVTNVINQEGPKQEQVIMLAQEFPIIKEEVRIKGKLPNSKIDYLLGNKDNIYLVELKTTDGSFENNQFEIYEECIIGGSRNLFNNFKNIIRSSLGNKNDEIGDLHMYLHDKIKNSTISEKNSHDYVIKRKGTKYKYMTTAISLINSIRKINGEEYKKDPIIYTLKDLNNLEDGIVESYFKGKTLNLIYITPSEVDKEIINITLKPYKDHKKNVENPENNKNYIGDIMTSKKGEWKLVLEILEDIYGKKEPKI